MKNIKMLMLSLLLMAGSVTIAFSQVGQHAEITVNLPGAKTTDTLWLSVWSHVLEDRNYMGKPSALTYITGVRDEIFHFKTNPEEEIVYFSLAKDRSGNQNRLLPIFNFYLIEKGDKIVVDLKLKKESVSMYGMINRDWIINFTGKGAEKLVCQQMLDQQLQRRGDREGQFIPDEVFEGNLKQTLNLLSGYKDQISPKAFEVLKTDQISRYLRGGISRLKRQYDLHNVQINAEIDSLLANNKWIRNRIASQEAAFISKSYAAFMVEYAEGLCLLYQYDKGSFIYNWIKNHENGLLRNKMLAYFVTKYGRTEYFDKVDIAELKAFTSNDDAKRKIESELDSWSGAVIAKNFILPDVHGKMVSLDSFKGKVVFIDFWFTGCGACTDYYQNALSAIEKKYKNHPEIVFVTISIDKDKSKWKASVDGGLYTSAEAINLFTGGLGVNHAVIEDYNVIDYPNPYLVAKDGRIFSSFELRNKRSLEKLIHEYLN